MLWWVISQAIQRLSRDTLSFWLCNFWWKPSLSKTKNEQAKKYLPSVTLAWHMNSYNNKNGLIWNFILENMKLCSSCKPTRGLMIAFDWCLGSCVDYGSVWYATVVRGGYYLNSLPPQIEISQMGARTHKKSNKKPNKPRCAIVAVALILAIGKTLQSKVYEIKLYRGCPADGYKTICKICHV